MAEMSGGEMVARMLSKEQVEKVFGIIDGTYFGFYSSLEKHGIDLITPRHETSAAHMAGAYARGTGKLGVCMASNGPGVANVLPGLVVEEAEGNRVLVITSARRTGIMYPDRGGTYQCFDQTGVISEIAKWSQAVPSFDRIPEMVRMALRKCYEGRPGVVHLDIPENIINTKMKTDTSFLEPYQYRLVDAISPSDEQMNRVVEMLLTAKTPMIHAGSGVVHSQAYEELQLVAEQLNVPVTTSWAGRGVLNEDLDYAIPMLHIELNKKVRNESDVVLVLGSRLGETDWWGKAPYWLHPSKQKMIQVDIDPATMGANKPANMMIQADLKVFLTQLYNKLFERREEVPRETRQAQLDKYTEEKKSHRQKLDQELEDMSSPMNSAHIATTCKKRFPEESYVVIDGGNTAIWANFYYKFVKPGRVLSTFKFGMLGAGMAQALGAAVADPDHPVCCIIGDGAMGFHPQEIETAVRNKLHIVYLVVCDKQWGMVKMNQQFSLKPVKTLVKKSLSEKETINADLGEIQFDKLAESMGAHGERVSDPVELDAAIQRSIDIGRCSVIHVDVNPVKHMWAPGLKYFKDMHAEPKGK